MCTFGITEQHDNIFVTSLLHSGIKIANFAEKNECNFKVLTSVYNEKQTLLIVAMFHLTLYRVRMKVCLVLFTNKECGVQLKQNR